MRGEWGRGEGQLFLFALFFKVKQRRPTPFYFIQFHCNVMYTLISYPAHASHLISAYAMPCHAMLFKPNEMMKYYYSRGRSDKNYVEWGYGVWLAIWYFYTMYDVECTMYKERGGRMSVIEVMADGWWPGLRPASFKL